MVLYRYNILLTLYYNVYNYLLDNIEMFFHRKLQNLLYMRAEH